MAHTDEQIISIVDKYSDASALKDPMANIEEVHSLFKFDSV